MRNKTQTKERKKTT